MTTHRIALVADFEDEREAERAEREALRRAVETPIAPHEPLSKWELYELRKSEVEATSFSAEEYERRLGELVEEMGL